MERAVKERMVGAAVLVIAAVILIPWLLDGKTKPRSTEHELVLPGNGQQQSEVRTINLDSSTPGGARPVAAESPKPQVANSSLPVESLPQASTPEPAKDKDVGDANTANEQPGTTERAIQTPPAEFSDVVKAEPESNAVIEEPETQPQPVATGGKAWAVQVGSFARQENAERLADRLRDKEYKAFVMRNVVEGRVRFRVRVGPVSNRDEADLLAAALKEDRQPARVLSHP